MKINPHVLKEAIIFVGGAAIGSGVTWFAVKRHYENLADKEIEEARKHYQEKVAEAYGKERVKKILTEQPEEKIQSVSMVDYAKKIQSDEGIDYTKFYANKKRVDPAEMEYPVEGDSEEEEHRNYIDGKRMSEESAENFGIELITPESFAVDYPQHDKETLFYWMDDETLSDENEQIIDNWKVVVGDCISQSGLPYTDTTIGVIYIRNFDLGTDYEIQKVAGSYKETIAD